MKCYKDPVYNVSHTFKFPQGTLDNAILHVKKVSIWNSLILNPDIFLTNQLPPFLTRIFFL